MKGMVSKILVFLFCAYVIGYMIYRGNHQEINEAESGHPTYVIFPKDQVWLYYLFRPMMKVDASVTGMRFHIGPHERRAAPPPEPDQGDD